MHPQDIGASEWLATLNAGYVTLAALALTALRFALLPYRSLAARSLSELAESLLMAGGVVFLIVRPFLLQAFFIPSESMEPTLCGHPAGVSSQTGQRYANGVYDHLFVNKLIYHLREPRPGDIIVFRAPKKADNENGHRDENTLIKRLIGVPGDTIEVHGNHVWRNGHELREPYVNPSDADFTPTLDGYGVGQAVTLGPGQLYVMGDNRAHSNDSRFWGPLDRSRVVGKASVVFWPPSRMGFIR